MYPFGDSRKKTGTAWQVVVFMFELAIKFCE